MSTAASLLLLPLQDPQEPLLSGRLGIVSGTIPLKEARERPTSDETELRYPKRSSIAAPSVKAASLPEGVEKWSLRRQHPASGPFGDRDLLMDRYLINMAIDGPSVRRYYRRGITQHSITRGDQSVYRYLRDARPLFGAIPDSRYSILYPPGKGPGARVRP